MKMLVSLLSLAFVLAAPALLSNCTGNAPVGGLTAEQSNASADQSATGQSASLQASALAPAGETSGDYRISPRDIIEVTVFQISDLNKAVQVGDDGAITLPLIGKMKVSGKTPHEAEVLIADKLRQRYLQSPQVSVFVKQYGQRITVSGEVKGPRVIQLDGTVTLSQAIANAGGLTELANTKRVHVARASNQRITDEVYNYEAIQAGQARDPVLQGGDLVVAEQSGAQVALKTIKDMLPFAVLASIL